MAKRSSMEPMSTAFTPEGMTDKIARAFDSMWANIGEAIDDRADRFPGQTGWMFPDAAGRWQEMSWNAFRDWVHKVAAGLLSIGIEPGSVASICAPTSIRWVLADFAMSTVGITTNTIYPNTRAADITFILEDSGSQAVFVADAKIAKRFLELGSAEYKNVLSQLRYLIVMDGGLPKGAGTAGTAAGAGATNPGAEGTTEANADPELLSWADIEARGEVWLREHPQAVREAQARTNHDTLATIIYTSGTTGRPKGVEITHGTWIYEAVGWGANDSIRDRQIHFIWLPLSHAFGKCMLLISLYTGTINAIDGRIDKIVENLGVLRPSLMCGVPRIFEKVRAGVMGVAPEGSVKRRLMDWAWRVGEESFPYRSRGLAMPHVLGAKYRVADRLVFSKVREQLGGRLDFLISGSARLAPEIQRWFFNLGIPMLEGYGVTETAAVTYYNRVQELRFGSVGRIIPGSATRIDPDTGEILIKGPCVMRGYHNDPELTARVVEDGWFHTGDIGYLDEDRFLYITDRIKDVIKTSNGKFVSPAEVEGMLRLHCPGIAQALVVGDGRKYCAALISVEPEWLEQWCKDHGREGLDYSEAARLPEVRQEIAKGVEAANTQLGRWETVKRFTIIPTELRVDDGMATPTLKLRRKHAIEHFGHEIEALYE